MEAHNDVKLIWISVGEFDQGLKQGYGSYTYFSSGDKYEGAWLNDEPHGKGAYTYSCGEVYRGEYLSGKKHGLGMYYFDDGTKMKAMWENDEMVEELPLDEVEEQEEKAVDHQPMVRMDSDAKLSTHDTEAETFAGRDITEEEEVGEVLE